MKRVLLVACLTNKYHERIGELRSLIPLIAPFFATSTTLDPLMKSDLTRKRAEKIDRPVFFL